MKGTMKVIDRKTGLMKCSVCGTEHFPMILLSGKLAPGPTPCVNGCKRESQTKKPSVLK